MDDIINIAFTSDINYFTKLAIAILSIKKNMLEERVHIYVLTDSENKDSEYVRRINQMCSNNLEITFLFVGENVFEDYSILAPGSHLTIATLYRLQLGRLLPESVDKLLFLDTDMLICSNLRPLYEEELDGMILGAVVEGADEDCDYLQNNASYLFEYYESKEEAFHLYFNAGTMLIDMKEFRKQNIGERCMKMLLEHPEFLLVDQDALNILCKKRIKYLDPKWNRIWRRQLADGSKGTGCLASSIDDIGIIHYCTGLKPWSDPEFKLADKFFEMAYDTEWYPEIINELRETTVKRIFMYKVPWSQIEAGTQVLIYGAGDVGQSFMRQMDLTGFCNIKAVIDKKAEDIKELNGVIVETPIVMYQKYQGETIIIAVLKENIRQIIKDDLVALGVPVEKIVWDYQAK